MKKILILLIGLLPALAQAQVVEKVYVSTDRSVYIAGDEVWCSLFCVDAGTGKLSPFSAVSYLELVSSDGTVTTAKAGLMEGRGAGKFRIPATAPTGNYRLIAYTAQNQAGYLAGSKLLSVFNTTSVSRVKDGVTVLPENEYKSLPATPETSDNKVSFAVTGKPRSGNSFSLNIENGSQAVDMSVSVFAVDEILPPSNGTLAAFLKQPCLEKASSNRLAEYEGEIVYAAVEGLAQHQLDSLSDMAVATLSSAGSPSDVYVGKVNDKGRLMFFTNNIYGDRELVCEVKSDCGYISLVDPFIRPSMDDISPLRLSSVQYGALVQRKAGIGNSLQADTLVQFLPRRHDVLLENDKRIHYHLDDYARFPSFPELIVEIIHELRLGTGHGRRELKMFIPDAAGSRKNLSGNILVMLDGVIINDVTLLEGMDALLLEDVDLYMQNILVGGLSFDGLVNFITRKNYVKALQFQDNVRVVDFKGVSYPVAYPGTPVKGADYRQLLYWHPSLKLAAGASERLTLYAPAYSGKFRVVAEGMDSQGAAFREVFDFKID
ncbi:MAG: hypothetical protein IK074_02165 [Bacteroidales bacterium]|nr:hypothetical protein [Bacteroidales bacterium]